MRRSPTAISEQQCRVPRRTIAASRNPAASASKILGEVSALLLCSRFGALAPNASSRDPRAKTLPASASRPSGRGNHAAADYFRGRHRLQQLRAGPQGRDAARARNRAQHPPRARRRDAAHDRRTPGAVADQCAAQTAISTVSAASPRAFSINMARTASCWWPTARAASCSPRSRPIPRACRRATTATSWRRCSRPSARNTRTCSSAR